MNAINWFAVLYFILWHSNTYILFWHIITNINIYFNVIFNEKTRGKEVRYEITCLHWKIINITFHYTLKNYINIFLIQRNIFHHYNNRDLTFLLITLIECGIGWSVPTLAYLFWFEFKPYLLIYSHLTELDNIPIVLTIYDKSLSLTKILWLFFYHLANMFFLSAFHSILTITSFNIQFCISQHNKMIF